MKIEKSTKSDIALAIFLNLYKIIYYYIFTLLGIDDYVALVIVGLYTTQSIILTLDRWEMENALSKLKSNLDDCFLVIDNLEEDAKEFRKEFNTFKKGVSNEL